MLACKRRVDVVRPDPVRTPLYDRLGGSAEQLSKVADGRHEPALTHPANGSSPAQTLKSQPFDGRWLPELMSWFPDALSCGVWAGPQFRFPFSEATFREDSRIGHLSSWSLPAADSSLGAFGQYYLRLGRCHLARLAVAPALRGQGIGGTLIRELCDRGCQELGTDSCSLFVLAGNAPALQLYRRLGFMEVTYPEPTSMVNGILYMVATLERLRQERAPDAQVASDPPSSKERR